MRGVLLRLFQGLVMVSFFVVRLRLTIPFAMRRSTTRCALYFRGRPEGDIQAQVVAREDRDRFGLRRRTCMSSASSFGLARVRPFSILTYRCSATEAPASRLPAPRVVSLDCSWSDRVIERVVITSNSLWVAELI